MKKKKEPTPEEIQAHAERVRQSEIADIQELINRGSLRPPTRLFKVGDSVRCGGLRNVTVKEVLLNGYAYTLHYDYIDNDSQVKHKVGDWTGNWLNVFPESSFFKSDSPIREKDDIQIRFANNDIDSLLHRVYSTSAGVDFNPDYQRDLVWTDEQKTSLLDSIFSNVDIGKFTFIKRDYQPNRVFWYEILDGKQRLSTLCDFYEDRFAWRGKKFSELCAADAYHFKNFPIVSGEVGEITEQQILKLFVKMNTSGTPIDQEHLNRIKSKITE